MCAINYFDYSQLQSTKKESEALEKELQTLRETYNNKQDAWIKEKLEIQVHKSK